jgi:hypothetical protein
MKQSLTMASVCKCSNVNETYTLTVLNVMHNALLPLAFSDKMEKYSIAGAASFLHQEYPE